MYSNELEKTNKRLEDEMNGRLEALEALSAATQDKK